MSFTTACGVPNYDPVPIPPLRAGEIDGRYIDTSTDLGVVGDIIPSIDNVFVSVTRTDGAALTANDLQVAGTDWPNTLDDTGLIITVGFRAPIASAGQSYWITLTISETFQGRLYIRDLTMTVAPMMG